eukprot:gene5849-6134_t
MRFSFSDRKKAEKADDRDGSTVKISLKAGTLSLKRSTVVTPLQDNEGSPVLCIAGAHRSQVGVLYSTKSASKFLVQLLGPDGLPRPAQGSKPGSARRNSSLASVPPSDLHLLSPGCLAEVRALRLAKAAAFGDQCFTAAQLEVLGEKATETASSSASIRPHVEQAPRNIVPPVLSPRESASAARERAPLGGQRAAEAESA